ncbi:MAG: hypothetical protein AB7O96_17440 [Pseudobdellovibrionaceae bacterium]
MELNKTFAYRKKDQRKISEFLGHELLYDYAIGALDSQTHKAMTDFLVQNKNAQKQLDKIYAGIKYADRLSGIQVPSETVKKVDIPVSYFESIIKQTNYVNWSNTMKWGAEAALVGFFVALFVSFLPWERLYLPNAPRMSGQVVLSEVQRLASSPSDDGEVIVAPTKEQALYKDDEEDEKKIPSDKKPTEPVKVAEKLTTEPAKPVAVVTAIPAPTPAAIGIGPPSSSSTTQPTVVTSELEKSSPGERGFVYRASLRTANLNAVSDKIKERIESIGGRKAGQVPLGWKRPGGSYFHFTIPENQYAEMENILEPYGKIKISRDPHPRVMPNGIIRFILWVEDVNTEGMSHEE